MNMKALMQQAKQMQKKMQKAEEEFAVQEFEFSTQGIKIKITGDNQIVAIDIDKDLVDPEDKDMLEDMMKVAINTAMMNVAEQKESVLGSAVPQIGGMGGFGF